MNNYDKFIIEWNNLFPLDRWYRKKYNIAFNSQQHQQVSQIDIYFEFKEEQLYNKYQKEQELKDKDEKEYKNGVWLKNQIDRVFEENEDELFDKIDIKRSNEKLQQEQE